MVLTSLPPSCADCLEIWEPQIHGTLRACPGLLQGLLYLYNLYKTTPIYIGLRLSQVKFVFEIVLQTWYILYTLPYFSLDIHEVLQC